MLCEVKAMSNEYTKKKKEKKKKEGYKNNKKIDK